jgi:hypothetical protein
VQGARRAGQYEVVDESAAAIERLGANAAPPGDQVLGSELRHEAAKRTDEPPAAAGAKHLGEPDAPVPPGETPDPGVREGAPGVAPGEGPARVAVAVQSENGVRAGLDRAVDAAGEVHAEKGEARIGDRVDETAHQRAPFGGELEVVAAKGDDADRRSQPGEPGDAVTVQTGAVDQPARLQRAAVGLDDELVPGGGDGSHPPAEKNVAAVALQLLGEGLGDAHEVDDSGLGHEEGVETTGVRLVVRDLPRRHATQAAKAVGAAAALELVETRHLGLLGRHDELAAQLEGEVALAAEVHQPAAPLDAQSSLARPRPVVEPGVEDATVVPGLVRGETGLGLDDGDAAAEAASEGPRRRQADDPGTHAEDVVADAQDSGSGGARGGAMG